MSIKKQIITSSSIYIFSICSMYIHSIYSIKNYNKVKEEMFINILQNI